MLDLHVHSTFSDGKNTPAEMVDAAAQKGIRGISLTDHDTMDGTEAAILAGLQVGVAVIPGVELSTNWQGKDIHILGYWVLEEGGLKNMMADARCARIRRAMDIVHRLNYLLEINPPLDMDHVLQLTGASPTSIGRPHIARGLVKLGLVQSEKEAFELYLEQGKPAFVPKRRIKPEDAVRAIVAAGGVAVWAHPGKLDFTLLDILVRTGLAGLEALHPAHCADVQRELLSIARAKRLVATGGSDAHSRESTGERTVDLGVWHELWSRRHSSSDSRA